MHLLFAWKYFKNVQYKIEIISKTKNNTTLIF